LAVRSKKQEVRSKRRDQSADLSAEAPLAVKKMLGKSAKAEGAFQVSLEGKLRLKAAAQP
jgi:hypothetical protein